MLANHQRLASFLLAVVGSVVLSTVSFYTETGSTTYAGGRTQAFTRHRGFVEVNGTWGVFLLVLTPVAFSIPLFFKRAPIPVAIGMFYLPSALLLFWPEQS
jgi:hypothetical protein